MYSSHFKVGKLGRIEEVRHAARKAAKKNSYKAVDGTAEGTKGRTCETDVRFGVKMGMSV